MFSFYHIFSALCMVEYTVSLTCWGRKAINGCMVIYRWLDHYSVSLSVIKSPVVKTTLLLFSFLLLAFTSMCSIALSRSLASSVFPWFPVHVCWQELLVLVSCPVMCNGDVVGLGPIYSPQPSAAWAAVRPDRPSFSSSAGVRCGTYLRKHYIIDSLCFEAFQTLWCSILPSILLSFLLFSIVKFY